MYLMQGYTYDYEFNYAGDYNVYVMTSSRKMTTAMTSNVLHLSSDTHPGEHFGLL